MGSLSRFSLLPLALLLMATSFLCSSAFAQASTDGLARPDGLNARKILLQSGGTGPRETVSSRILAALGVKAKNADDLSDDISGDEYVCSPGMTCWRRSPPKHHHHQHHRPAPAPTPGHHHAETLDEVNRHHPPHHHHHHHGPAPAPTPGHHHAQSLQDEITHHHHTPIYHEPPHAQSLQDEITHHHHTPIYHEPPHAQSLQDEINHHHHTPIYHEPPHAQMTSDSINQEAGVVEPDHDHHRRKRCRDNPHLCNDLDGEVEPDRLDKPAQAVTTDDLGASVRY